jgi:hypothetical protein
MDYVTFATQVVGGIAAAIIAGLLWRPLSLGVLGNVIAGIVGGGLGGLILTQYLDLAPAGQPDGTIAEPSAVLMHIASGGAGGAALMILTGLIIGPRQR